MNVVSCYRDLVEEIEIYEFRLQDLEREYYALQRFFYNNKITYKNYLTKNYTICNGIAIVTAVLRDKRETKKQIEDKLNKLDGLEYKIAYKRFVENKDLNTIADELHISESWTRKKSAIVSKDIKE